MSELVGFWEAQLVLWFGNHCSPSSSESSRPPKRYRDRELTTLLHQRRKTVELTWLRTPDRGDQKKEMKELRKKELVAF